MDGQAPIDETNLAAAGMLGHAGNLGRLFADVQENRIASADSVSGVVRAYNHAIEFLQTSIKTRNNELLRNTYYDILSLSTKIARLALERKLLAPSEREMIAKAFSAHSDDKLEEIMGGMSVDIILGGLWDQIAAAATEKQAELDLALGPHFIKATEIRANILSFLHNARKTTNYDVTAKSTPRLEQ